MLKKLCIFFLVFYFALHSVKGQSSFARDSLLNILQVKDKNSREEILIRYIKIYFRDTPVKNSYVKKAELDELLNKYDAEEKEEFEYFIESIYQRILSHKSESENAMIKAIQIAEKNRDDYLSYAFLADLAYKQAEDGDVIAAVSSYRMAKREAIKLSDTNLQMGIDISISDVFYKNNFYNQSLFYLNEAEATSCEFWPDDQRIKNVIYYNKSENFFRMNEPDSLKVYNEKLKKSKANTYKLYTYKNRTDYYLYLLSSDYKNAIARIHAMQNDEGYKFDDQDLQNLADAYYKNGQLDSAKFIINHLLSKPSETNHPEIEYHLYDVLGKIAEQQADYPSASANFKLALQRSEDIMNQLTQVDNISSLIKADEMEDYYSQKNEVYRRERIWLMILVIFAILIILVIAMFYRTIKQKRHYENLLFATKKEELAFINSHDVRKHLTNILGLIEVIKDSEHKEKEYLEVEDYLFHSAEQLDNSIKNISKKLDD